MKIMNNFNFYVEKLQFFYYYMVQKLKNIIYIYIYINYTNSIINEITIKVKIIYLILFKLYIKNLIYLFINNIIFIFEACLD
jgi:hypothetical protein